MIRLAAMIYAMASVTLMGILIIAALVSGYDTKEFVVIAAAVGAVVALPVSYYIAKAIS